MLTTKKILIAYYSLRNGNARIVAEQIKSDIGGDIFRIETVNAYPKEYRDVITQSKKEFETGYKPALKRMVKNIEQYDIVIIGSPCWFGTIAPAVVSFLSSYNLSGKTIVPFITNEGSNMGHSEKDIKNLCPQSILLNGIPIRSEAVQSSQNEIIEWLRNIKLA
ncbi:MAG: flavodoxin [Bacteroidales bacterium]